MAYECNFVVIDLETGGLITKEGGIPPVTEIAACAVDGVTLEDIGEFSSLIKPYVDLNKYTAPALAVSNISIDLLNKEGKQSEVVIKDFITFLKKVTKKKKCILIGHNIDDFDLPIIDKFFKDFGEDLSKYVEFKTSIDTMWWMRFYKPEMAKFNLGVCLEDMNIDLQQAHRALNDTRATKSMWVKLMKNLRGSGSGPVTIERKRIKFQF